MHLAYSKDFFIQIAGGCEAPSYRFLARIAQKTAILARFPAIFAHFRARIARIWKFCGFRNNRYICTNKTRKGYGCEPYPGPLKKPQREPYRELNAYSPDPPSDFYTHGSRVFARLKTMGRTFVQRSRPVTFLFQRTEPLYKYKNLFINKQLFQRFIYIAILAVIFPIQDEVDDAPVRLVHLGAVEINVDICHRQADAVPQRLAHHLLGNGYNRWAFDVLPQPPLLGGYD